MTTVRKLKKTTTRASAKRKPAATSTAGSAHKMLLAGMGAANRLQDEASKVYGRLAGEAKRLTAMTNDAAQALANKAGLLVREGQKQQSQGLALLQERASALTAEMKSFVAKSERLMKNNIGSTLASTAEAGRAGVTQLEDVFENRVAKTLNTFGLPSSKNVRELQARMADLQKALNQLNKRVRA